MGKYLVAVVVGVAVTVGLLWGGHALFASMGGQPPRSLWFAATALGVFIIYIMANLAGTRKTATAGDAERLQALAFSPPADKAALYLYREGFIGKAAGLNVFVDDKPVAQLKAPRFTRVLIAPGPHTVRAAFGGLAGAQNKPGELAVTAQAGQALPVRLTLSMGAFQNTIRLEVADLDGAKARLARMAMTAPDLAEA